MQEVPHDVRVLHVEIATAHRHVTATPHYKRFSNLLIGNDGRGRAYGFDAVDDTLDSDGDGVTDELLPGRDAAGRLVYAVDFGSAGSWIQARLPEFARVDVRAT